MSAPAACSRLGARLTRLGSRVAPVARASFATQPQARAAAVGPCVTRAGLTSRLRPLARHSALTSWRQFCAEAAAPLEPPIKRRPKKPAGPPVGKIAGVVIVVGGGIAYAVSEDARATLDEYFNQLVELFEDFNDSSREFFEGLGDKIVSKPKEPWLLDLETMKYPENIPTLVIDLDKVILHLNHDSRQGWHVIKRPFADQFFKEIRHYYEVVIFSDDVFPVALDISMKWDLPVTGVLHRDFCKKKRSHYVKDISKLGRKLDRVLIIDHDEHAFQLQPENGILIKPFTGDPSDSELADLLEFLKAAATATGDIRQFAQKFGGGDVDIGRRYLLHKQEQDAKVEERRKVGRYFSASKGFPPAAGGMGMPGQFGGMR